MVGCSAAGKKVEYNGSAIVEGGPFHVGQLVLAWRIPFSSHLLRSSGFWLNSSDTRGSSSKIASLFQGTLGVGMGCPVAVDEYTEMARTSTRPRNKGEETGG